jgi:4-hydroxybenzoate polyprenyltransferase
VFDLSKKPYYLDQQTETPEISYFSRLWAWLELMRPPNIITAFADIMAGVAAAGGVVAIEQEVSGITWTSFGLLLISSLGLYGGGVVFNDVFDAKLDAEERPERAIPSGRVTKAGAAIMGATLLLVGVFAAFQVTVYSGLIATAITVLALFYDAWAKHSVFWGPLMMGFCRGGNLLLGCSILPSILPHVWFIALLPILYIASITLISQGEVKGGSKIAGMGALVLLNLVTIGLFSLVLLVPSFKLLTSIPFIALFTILVIPTFVKAAIKPVPRLIRSAVRTGVLSLIILNSAIAGGFAGFIFGICVLLLLPLSYLLSRLFAVT